MTRREERRDDLGERENKAKNQVSEPKRLSSLLFFGSSSVFPLPLPLPKKALSSPYTKGEEEGEREMPVPPKTPRTPMTPNSQAMTNNVLLDGSLSERRKSKIPIELWVRGIALLGVLLVAVLLVMHGSKSVVKRRRDKD